MIVGTRVEGWVVGVMSEGERYGVRGGSEG